MLTSEDKCRIVTEAILSLTGERVLTMKTYPTDDWHVRVYDTIQLQGETAPPLRQAFEAKLQELIDAQPWNELRALRNERLTETDKYTSIPDYPHPTPESKQAWLDYRQALRDLPANTTDPLNPVWPEAPTP